MREEWQLYVSLMFTLVFGNTQLLPVPSLCDSTCVVSSKQSHCLHNRFVMELFTENKERIGEQT